ncbi:hypothetical protein CIB84_000709 [Bambusicola thoracicus]|uniref:Uncharacterized protein n=1 Tax=Bambusicola thoracicus TaxID=9083 RepID=A0A2P4TGQ8_BAMTH|nr:hypothetical protein CIB84_000709 [Bambusicola thoracicus]
MIIDMITELQASNSLKIVEPEGDFCIPSCLGGITDENGGSNLHPQSPLDDVNVVDLKWICNLILKTLEFLYQMKKWEALVHIALQFNVFTHERYTEQVSPLLVYAQRQLLGRIQQFSGPGSHESHFTKYLSDNANKLSCRDYIGQNLQLPVARSASILVFPGCFFCPEMKNDYAEILEVNNQKDLKVQALHELGNLHFYAGNKRYIATSNVRLRTKYCHFSAILFKTLFRASLPHPTSDCDFAQYETHMLIPGIDLFSDRYRADISTVVASLNFLMFELHCAKQNLTTLLYFDSSKSLLSFTNLQVLEDIFNWSLSLTVVPLCSQQIMNKLTLAKMHFIICLSATINNIPEKVEKCIYSVDNKPDGNTPSNVKVDAVKNSRQREQRDTVMQLIDCEAELNMAMLKGILLTEAEESLNHLVQNIQDKYDGKITQCSAEDLEVLTEAKLQLAAISQQWHRAALSVALAFSAIRLLQDADIFRMTATNFHEKKDKRESLDSCVEDAQQAHSIIAQDHLNVNLWLRCRKMLVTALATQLHSVGDKEENYVAEHRSIIKEVILEAEAFGDTETQAEMMVQAAILDVQEGCPMADIKLLLQIFSCGEYIEQQIEDSTLTCLVLPAKNIYLPYINLLAQVKMRIGNTLAERVACTPEGEDLLQWLHALKHLETALKLCRASATEVLDMEAQLLFQIGKVECQIAKAVKNKPYRAVETLLEAIKLSQQHDQNFELIRRSYLEIALLYLHFSTNNENLSQRDKMVPSKSGISAGELSSSSGEALKSEGYKVQAWIALRAARQVSEAVVASQLLIGMESIKEHNVKDALLQKIPEFASMDLLASYRDYLSGIIFCLVILEH